MRYAFKCIGCSFLSASFIFTFIFSISAQEPSREDIGAQSSRFQEEFERKKRELKELEKKLFKTPEIEIQKEEKPSALVVSLILREVIITGTTVFTPQDFRSLYEPYIGKEVTPTDLEAIVEKIKAKYRESGYLTTTAYIPEQELKEGRIEIRALEGRLGEVKIEGNR